MTVAMAGVSSLLLGESRVAAQPGRWRLSSRDFLPSYSGSQTGAECQRERAVALGPHTLRAAAEGGLRWWWTSSVRSRSR